MGVEKHSQFEISVAKASKGQARTAKRQAFSAITCGFSLIMVLSRLHGASPLSFVRNLQYCKKSVTYQRKYHPTTICRLNRFLFSPEELTLLEEDEISSDEPSDQATPPRSTSGVILPKDDYRTIHAAKILGLRNGDSIRAGLVGEGDPRGVGDGSSGVVGQWTDEATIEWLPEPPVKKAEVLKNGNPPGSLSIRLNNLKSIVDVDARASPASDPINVSLILALPRPLQLGRILPMISQIGIDHLILTSAKKVPKDYFGSHLFRKPEILREKLIEGLCQAGDVRLPKLHVVKNLRGFLLSDEFERLFPKDACARVVAHPKRQDDKDEPLRMSEVAFPPTTNNVPPRIVIAVGPEGGWEEPNELDMFKNDCGFQQITLGSRTLRSDVAVVGLLSLAHEACHHATKSLEDPSFTTKVDEQ